jgi:hypothetical protein
MRKILRFFVLFLWVGFWAGVCCRLYYENLDRMPSFPKAFWFWLERLFQAYDADSWETVEIFTMLTVMFVLVSIFHAIAFFAWRKMKRRKTNSH